MFPVMFVSGTDVFFLEYQTYIASDGSYIEENLVNAAVD
jgi:hypothetical protein